LLQQGKVPRTLVISRDYPDFRHWKRREDKQDPPMSVSRQGEARASSISKSIRVADVLHDFVNAALAPRKEKQCQVRDTFQMVQGVDRHLLFVPLAQEIAKRLKQEGFEVELHAMHPESILPGMFAIRPNKETIKHVKAPLSKLAEYYPASSFQLQFRGPPKIIKTLRLA